MRFDYGFIYNACDDYGIYTLYTIIGHTGHTTYNEGACLHSIELKLNP